MLALRCAAMIVAVWPLLAVTSVSVVARQKRQLQNSYLGLGSNVEILPVGDTSGVSSSYSVVETSKVPRREHNSYRSRTSHRDSEPENSEYRAYNKHPSPRSGVHAGEVQGQKPFRFPEERRKAKPPVADAEDQDEDLDSILEPNHRRSDLTPANRKKYKPKKPQAEDEESLEESKSAPRNSKEPKPAPRNIKEIVEERPAESKISSDLKDEGSRYIGHGSGGYGGGSEYDKEKHYDKEQGQKFLEGHKSEEGEKAEKAFKKEEAYDKGEKEDYGSDEKHSQVAEKAGEKKGHVDQAQHFGEAYHGNHGEKGITVVKKGGHKKGKKTSGFHKVHHKDEYKKDEVFYDESHDGGEHEEHKHEQEKHAKEKGGHEKKGHSDTGYHESHGSKKAESDHGKKYEQAKGHKSEAGEQAHHGQQSEFSKKGGVKEGEKYGHADAGGGGYFEKGGYF